MNLVFILIAFLFSSITLFSSSYAQEDDVIRIIYAQLIVRDSNGNLVTYLESSNIRHWDAELIEQSINSDSTKIISSEQISIKGALYERIVFEKEPILYVTESQRGVTFLGIIKTGIGLPGASFMNDGYFHLPDDKITAIWTALRPLE